MTHGDSKRGFRKVGPLLPTNDRRERFVDDCVLDLLGGSVTVSLCQSPSAKTHSNQTSAAAGHGGGGGGQRQGKTKGKPANDRDADPALTGTTVVRISMCGMHAFVVRENACPDII